MLYLGIAKYKEFLARYALMLSQLSIFYFLQDLADWPVFLALFSLQGLLSVIYSNSSSRVIIRQNNTVVNFNLFEGIAGIVLMIYSIYEYGLVSLMLFASFLSIPLETHLKLIGRQFDIYIFYSLINLSILIFFKSATVAIFIVLTTRMLILLVMNKPNGLKLIIHREIPNFNAYFLNRQNIITHYLGLIFVSMDNGMILKIITSVGNLVGASLNVRNFQGDRQNVLSDGKIVALNIGTILIFWFGKDLSISFGFVTLLQSYVSFLLWPLFRENARLSAFRLLLLIVLLCLNLKNLLIGYFLFESFSVLWRKRI